MKKIILLPITVVIMAIFSITIPMYRSFKPLRKIGLSRLKKKGVSTARPRQRMLPKVVDGKKYWMSSTKIPPTSSAIRQYAIVPEILSEAPSEAHVSTQRKNQIIEAFKRAVFTQDIKTIQALSQYNIDLNSDHFKISDFNPLVTATLLSDLSLVQELLKMGADPNFATLSSTNALARAIEMGEYNIAEELISAGANVNAKVNEYTLIEHAVILGETNMARLLARHGAKKSGAPLLQELENKIDSLLRNNLLSKAAFLYRYFLDKLAALRWWKR